MTRVSGERINRFWGHHHRADEAICCTKLVHVAPKR